MSAETLKFFEDKSTTSIINWMMSHLTEEQIRMCLDQSGIPDTSGISEGSSSGTVPEPVPEPTPEPVPTPDPSGRTKTAAEKFTEKYRNKCYDTPYLIKSVSKEGVEYYEFKEVDPEDVELNPNLSGMIGQVNWVFSIKPVSQFKDYCTDEDKEIFALLKEENESVFINAPPEVLAVARDYIQNGLASPIPAPLDLPVPTPVLPEVPITEPIVKAVRIQQTTSEEIRRDYPDLYNRGVTMYPIFVYGSDGDRVKHLNVEINDSGRLVLVEDSTNKRLLNSKFKKVLANLNNSITSGLYNVPDNIRDDMNQALRTVDSSIPKKIETIYDPQMVRGYTFFGSLEDEPFDEITEEDVEVARMEIEEGFPVAKLKETKKVSDMTIEELEERARRQFGAEYVKKYKPIKYTNAIGVENVKYIRREPSESEDYEMIERTPFVEFQGRPAVNDGPGRFGMDDDDLLFLDLF